jgi:hypothetical protein
MSIPLPVRRFAAVVLALGLFTVGAACRPSGDRAPETEAVPEDAFQKTDPAKVGTSGRPQLVEFYHPT